MAKAYGLSICMRRPFSYTAAKAKSRPPFHSLEGNSFAICEEQEGNDLGTRLVGKFLRRMLSSEANMVGNELCIWPAIRYKYIWPFDLGGSEAGVDSE